MTSGIDFALTLAACLFGEEPAKRAQLAMEHDPEPPFVGGTPASAGPQLVESLRAENSFSGSAKEAARRTAAALQID